MSDLLYGINPVVEALRGSRRKPQELLLQDDARSPRLEELQQTARQQNIPVRLCRRQELDKLAGNNRHQGVLLRISPFPYIDIDELIVRARQSDRPVFILILDGITDPHNFGAILRSADAVGCHGVIVAKDRSCPVTGVVEKSAAGALSHIPLCQVTNLARTMDRLREEHVWLYGLAGEEGASSLYDIDLKGDLALVVGSEGSGLRPVVRKRCDLFLSIPMAGGVSSLNASVAAAVTLFEVVRQRVEKKGRN
ncbi:MAG: 23S rRNA (guanosine(2251)-2'-O)-methyltransferase RlmB [Desulfuromonas sp.]|nr:MAG: 23S rRNA (guanosine(2251)-2'-O)-methyltransferase RlmB [Desulfuromonas sp.]